MGKIHLIPPMTTFQRTYQNYTPAMTNNGTMMYPVQFTSYPVYSGQTAAGGYVPNESSTMHAHVQVPATTTTEELYNPIQGAVELFCHGYRQTSHHKVHRKTERVPFEPTFHMVQGAQVSHMFWDFKDIEDYVADWVGDLLVSINCNNMSPNNITSNAMWSFAPTRFEDSSRLQSMLSRKKSLHFPCAKDMREKYLTWLDKSTTEYEFIEDYTRDYGKEDLLYIRSDAEAVHFKMRWFGVSLEEETELEAEE